MNPLEKAIHERALEIAGRYRKDEGELFEILLKVDEKKVFRVLGFRSLFDYAVKALRLTEATASNFITVARKARGIPLIKEEIMAGKVSIATVRKVMPVIEASNAGLWLEKVKTLSKPQLEKEVATLHPQALTPERARYVTAKRVALSLGVSEEVYEKLKRVKDIVSQNQRSAATVEDALAEMIDLYLEKNDPVVKAKRIEEKKTVQTNPKSVPGLVSQILPNRRPKLPAAVRHAVILREGGQCSFEDARGGHCGERRWLDFHHILHRSAGGPDTTENLTLLCSGHHRLVHDSK